LERRRIAHDEEGISDPLELGFERFGVEALALDHERGAEAIARELLVYGFGGELFGRRRFGQRLAGDRGGEPAHELQQTGAAGVDEPRVTEDVELLPRLRHCSLPAFDERV